VIPKAIIYFLRPKSSVIRSLFTITRGLFEICWSLPQTYLLRPKLSTWTRTSSENEQMVRRPTKWKGRQMHERNCTPRRLGQCEQHTHSRFCAIPITRRGNFEAPSMFQVLFQKKNITLCFKSYPPTPSVPIYIRLNFLLHHSYDLKNYAKYHIFLLCLTLLIKIIQK
jgi:hypothetical protein